MTGVPPPQSGVVRNLHAQDYGFLTQKFEQVSLLFSVFLPIQDSEYILLKRSEQHFAYFVFIY